MNKSVLAIGGLPTIFLPYFSIIPSHKPSTALTYYLLPMEYLTSQISTDYPQAEVLLRQPTFLQHY